MANLDQMLKSFNKEGHICPQPQPWNQHWKLLPDRQRDGGGWNPPPPLILAAWWVTGDVQKRERFEMHLRWAADHGCLDAVADYLCTLQPADWHPDSNHD